MGTHMVLTGNVEGVQCTLDKVLTRVLKGLLKGVLKGVLNGYSQRTPAHLLVHLHERVGPARKLLLDARHLQQLLRAPREYPD